LTFDSCGDCFGQPVTSLRERRSGLGVIDRVCNLRLMPPPSGSDWIHEIKHDDIRIMARRDRHDVPHNGQIDEAVVTCVMDCLAQSLPHQCRGGLNYPNCTWCAIHLLLKD
jgi:hypothetical protein